MKKDNLSPANIANRVAAPTPSFWKKIRNIALAALAISGAILTAPVALPAAVVTIAGYVATAGAVAAAVSQATKQDNADASAK